MIAINCRLGLSNYVCCSVSCVTSYLVYRFRFQSDCTNACKLLRVFPVLAILLQQDCGTNHPFRKTAKGTLLMRSGSRAQGARVSYVDFVIHASDESRIFFTPPSIRERLTACPWHLDGISAAVTSYLLNMMPSDRPGVRRRPITACPFELMSNHQSRRLSPSW